VADKLISSVFILSLLSLFSRTDPFHSLKRDPVEEQPIHVPVPFLSSFLSPTFSFFRSPIVFDER